MEIALTHTCPIPFDDYPDHSLFLCQMCNLDSCLKHHNGRVLLLHHIKSGDYATLSMPGIDYGYFYKGEHSEGDLRNLPYDAWEPVTFKVEKKRALFGGPFYWVTT